MKVCLASKTPDSNPNLFFHAYMVGVWACSQLWDWSSRLLPNCSAILITLRLKWSVPVSPLWTAVGYWCSPSITRGSWQHTYTHNSKQRPQSRAQSFRKPPIHSLSWCKGGKPRGEARWTENPNKPFTATQAQPGAGRTDSFVIPSINTRPRTSSQITVTAGKSQYAFNYKALAQCWKMS